MYMEEITKAGVYSARKINKITGWSEREIRDLMADGTLLTRKKDTKGKVLKHRLIFGHSWIKFFKSQINVAKSTKKM